MMRCRRISVIALCFGLLLVAAPGHGTIIIALDIEELVESADMVVRGHVELSESFWDDRVIVTDTTVVVDECLAGLCDSRVVVRQAGGQVGNLTMEVAGLRSLVPGDEVVLFLRPNTATGHLMTVGQCQGILRVDGDLLQRDLSDVLLVSETGAAVEATPLPLTLDELRGVIRD